MDVDPGESFTFRRLSLPLLMPSSDMPVVVKERPKSVRRLPYVLVPGMDANSRLFHKAQATIAKQASALPSSSSPASTERLFNLQQG